MSTVIALFPLLIAVAFYTLSERKTRAIIQRRWGPDNVGFYGLGQPFADAIKLLAKDRKLPKKISYTTYRIAPRSGVFFSFRGLVSRQFGANITLLPDLSLSGLVMLITRSFSSYSIVFGGWASNAKYSILGSLRAITQRIAYEIFRVFTLLRLFRMTSSFSLNDIVFFQSKTAPFFVICPFLAISFLFANLRETNRIPFDLSEAEAELVAGYNVEYGGVFFLRYFLAEYLNRFFRSLINVLLFYGGYFTFSWISPRGNRILFWLKIIRFSQLLIFLRALLPRYRYDQRIFIGWKVILPSLRLIFPTRFIIYWLRWSQI